MDDKELIEYFKSQMKEDPDMASAVAAIRTLLEFLKRDKGETIQGLRANLTSAIETLCGVDSSVAVSSGGELFLRFISLASLEYSDYSKCKKIMIERGELFLRRISLSRNKIADLCHTFIKDGATILTHAYSRVVLRVLEAAVAAKKRFSVYVTESQPDLSGQVPFCSVMCPATILQSKLQITVQQDRNQNVPPACQQSALPFIVPFPAFGRKITEFAAGHSI
ncbi:EIF2B1 isoform 1 [Pongo abelii]|uniref:Translation initiation factor eIF2B subunit alpha n=1 Tax=Pongo abelii TaxID=9601 RepID=A0A2J8XJE8_PONAB|nr:EIF2B1 isoform 1 [Pongo abelii]